jgi:hypothetical protein
MKHDLGLYFALWIIIAPVVASFLLSGIGSGGYAPRPEPEPEPRR